jgi:hypothetical protein
MGVLLERVLAKHALEVLGGAIVQIVKLLLPALGLRLLLALGVRLVLDHVDAGALGERTYGLYEVEPLRLLDELEDVARSMATEAMIEAALGVDVKARRFLFVKRTQTREAAAAPLQLDRLADQLDDLRLASDAVNRLLPDHPARPLPQNFARGPSKTLAPADLGL